MARLCEVSKNAQIHLHVWSPESASRRLTKPQQPFLFQTCSSYLHVVRTCHPLLANLLSDPLTPMPFLPANNAVWVLFAKRYGDVLLLAKFF